MRQTCHIQFYSENMQHVQFYQFANVMRVPYRVSVVPILFLTATHCSLLCQLMLSWFSWAFFSSFSFSCLSSLKANVSFLFTRVARPPVAIENSTKTTYQMLREIWLFFKKNLCLIWIWCQQHFWRKLEHGQQRLKETCQNLKFFLEIMGNMFSELKRGGTIWLVIYLKPSICDSMGVHKCTWHG